MTEIKDRAYAAIIGCGRTKFDELWEESMSDLMLESLISALTSTNGNIEFKNIESMYVGNFISEKIVDQGLVAGELAQHFGTHIPIFRLEGACASAGLALHNACLGIKSGKFDIVAVTGVEKMTDRGEIVTDALASAASDWERFYGNTFPGLYATLMARHMYEYGTTREQLAMVSMKNHQHAVNNKYAQYPFPIKVESVLRSPLIADPIRLLDCSPISDGASSVILCNPEIAKRYTESPVYITGAGTATDSLSYCTREDLTGLTATRIAAQQAFKDAKIEQKDVNIIELHDCFTIEEITALEDMKFVEKGEGGPFIGEAVDSFKGSKHIIYPTKTGEIVVNCGGGLKADGHPVGATGSRQICEIWEQLVGIAEKKQVDLDTDLTTAVAHNIGGTGGVGSVHVLQI
jgi:acetyl-CoA C-acetyltransferase